MSNLNQFLKSFEENDKDKKKAPDKLIIEGTAETTLQDIKYSSPEVKELPKFKLNKKEEVVEVIQKPNSTKLNLNKKVAEEIPYIQEEVTTIVIEEVKLEIKKKVEPAIIEVSKEEKENQLFLLSETPQEFKKQWIDLFNKANESNKNTMTNAKVKSGKFRFNRQGEVEILPDHDVANKTSAQLLKEIWD